MTHSAKELLIGAHTSTAGGVHNALIQGKEIGATTIQLFTSNQRQWKGRIFSQDDLLLWEKYLKETGLKQIMSHDSYLINLGASDLEIHQKSEQAFEEELKRCHQLDISFLNFHPGAATGESTIEQCLDQIISSLKKMEKLCAKGETRILLEATAGQGNSVGHRFEHLSYIIEGVKAHLPIGVCIDTCHIFAAGYDIRTSEAWEKTLAEFDRIVGIENLYAFHLNDSLKPLGSRRDRHAHLGEGEIGIACFEFVMTHPKLREIPKYLETPEGPSRWIHEIALLREFANAPQNQN